VFFFKLVFRNALRARLRTALTVLGLVIALLAFGLLQTVVKAWYGGADSAASNRLVTRNAISLVFSLPMYYREKIRSVDGVRAVAVSNWFGGVWRDESSFFAQFAVDADQYFPMYPEFVFQPAEYSAYVHDRQGAAIGRQLANLYGFKVGDRLPIRGTIYTGNWEFTIRAIYDGRDSGVVTRQMYFHYDYLNEFLKLKAPRFADRAGVFVVDVKDATRVAEVARAIDATFANSLAETLTESEKAFLLSFAAMLETIMQVISGVSYIVIVIILAVAANTMAMTARERLSEYATLKALGFGPGFVARLILAESVLIGVAAALIAIALTGPAAHGVFETVGKTVFARFDVAPSTYLFQVAAGLGIAVLAALVPMVRSARVKIVDGLRHVG
jgi:putative ABC transport system permease protein